MTLDEFSRLLDRFATRPVPATAGRHVYLWHGDLAVLHSRLPADLVLNLDLNEMAAELPRAPSSPQEARKLLVDALRAWLDKQVPYDNNRRIVVVSCTALLMRYKVPLYEFFQATSDSCLVILVVPDVETNFDTRSLPPYVDVRPRATLDYLQVALGSAATIGA